MGATDTNGTSTDVSIDSATSGKDLPQSMIERITLILDTFDRRCSVLTLEQVALGSQLPRSTVHRILDQLVKLGWVEHGTFGYSLGRRAFGLNGGENDPIHLRKVAAPLLHEMHLRTGLVVHLSVLDGSENVYLDKLGGRSAAVPSRVGGRHLAHATADGKAMLAWLDPEHIGTMFEPTLPRYTTKTITDRAVLHQELSRIRQRDGLAFECGESTPAVSGVAAAIRGYEGTVGAIALYGMISDAQLVQVAPMVADTVRQVSRILYPDRGASHRRYKRPSTQVESFSAEALARLLAGSADFRYV